MRRSSNLFVPPTGIMPASLAESSMRPRVVEVLASSMATPSTRAPLTGFPSRSKAFTTRSSRYCESKTVQSTTFQTGSQQIYNGSAFTRVMPTGGWIRDISFRVDGMFGVDFSAGLTNFQLHLSTTTRSPDGFSGIFSENVGTDDTAVLAGTVVLEGSRGGQFGGVIFYFGDHPFYYDPSQGNLLMDFRIFSPAVNFFPPGGTAIKRCESTCILLSSVHSVRMSRSKTCKTKGTNFLGASAFREAEGRRRRRSARVK